MPYDPKLLGTPIEVTATANYATGCDVEDLTQCIYDALAHYTNTITVKVTAASAPVEPPRVTLTIADGQYGIQRSKA